MNKDEYDPDYVSHPSTTVRETLDALGKTYHDLVVPGVISEHTAHCLYYGDVTIRIDEDVAQVLERVTGVPISFWRMRWHQYRQHAVAKHRWYKDEGND